MEAMIYTSFTKKESRVDCFVNFLLSAIENDSTSLMLLRIVSGTLGTLLINARNVARAFRASL
jgi:hypothetical protein